MLKRAAKILNVVNVKLSVENWTELMNVEVAIPMSTNGQPFKIWSFSHMETQGLKTLASLLRSIPASATVHVLIWTSLALASTFLNAESNNTHPSDNLLVVAHFCNNVMEAYKKCRMTTYFCETRLLETWAEI